MCDSVSMEKKNNPAGHDRADQLQFLRFIAFVLIFNWHMDWFAPQFFPRDLGGACAVEFFFLLSGFGSAYSSYNRDVIFSWRGLFDYLKKKLKKAYPLYFVVIASISDPIAVYEGRVILYPIKPTLEGYGRILSYSSLFVGYKNTLFYTLLGTSINIVLTITSGYALSRKELVGRNVMMMGVMFTMIFSGGMIPNYLLVRSLGLYNTMWALILPGAVSTWNLIVCRTFFQQTIPDELREAAELDGCGDTSFFLRVLGVRRC